MSAIAELAQIPRVRDVPTDQYRRRKSDRRPRRAERRLTLPVARHRRGRFDAVAPQGVDRRRDDRRAARGAHGRPRRAAEVRGDRADPARSERPAGDGQFRDAGEPGQRLERRPDREPGPRADLRHGPASHDRNRAARSGSGIRRRRAFALSERGPLRPRGVRIRNRPARRRPDAHRAAGTAQAHFRPARRTHLRGRPQRRIQGPGQGRADRQRHRPGLSRRERGGALRGGAPRVGVPDRTPGRASGQRPPGRATRRAVQDGEPHRRRERAARQRAAAQRDQQSVDPGARAHRGGQGPL